jgi:hypothetical protein
MTQEEQAAYPGYNYEYDIDVTYGHVTQSVVATAQTFNVFLTKAKYDQMRNVALVLVEPFQNTADNAFNSCTLSVGKTGTVAAYVLATELNKNGAFVNAAYSTGAGLPETYIAATQIIVTLNSMAAKALSNLNKGRVLILFNMYRPQSDVLLRPTGAETISP